MRLSYALTLYLIFAEMFVIINFWSIELNSTYLNEGTLPIYIANFLIPWKCFQTLIVFKIFASECLFLEFLYENVNKKTLLHFLIKILMKINLLIWCIFLQKEPLRSKSVNSIFVWQLYTFFLLFINKILFWNYNIYLYLKYIICI